MTERVLPAHPFRLLTSFAATFPKGTALVAAARFPAVPKGVLLGERSKPSALTEGCVHTSFTSLLLSVLCGLWYTMVIMGHHGYTETDRM